MKKALLRLVLMVFLSASAFAAEPELKINGYVEGHKLNKTSVIAVSVKDAGTGRKLYCVNEDKLLHPASTLKLFTTAAALDTLGRDYKFTTAVYKDKSNNLYLKLSADPLLTSKDLKSMIREAKTKITGEINNVYIDETVLDSQDWGIGWMWDDNTNSRMPKFNAYNLDGNVLKVNITPTNPGEPSTISKNNTYFTSIINESKTGETNSLQISRRDWISPDIVYITGTVKSPVTVNIPNNNLKRYFSFKLKEALESAKIKCEPPFYSKPVTPDLTLLASFESDVMSVAAASLKNSDNVFAETIFRVAGGKYKNGVGNIFDAIIMFKDFYNKLGSDSDSVLIVDGSGVSRNNLVNARWMSDSLVKIAKRDNFDDIKGLMAQPGAGTLGSRLESLSGDVWCKTGTLSGISGMTGYIRTKNDRLLAYTVLIQNFTAPASEVKNFEDEILLKLYKY